MAEIVYNVKLNTKDAVRESDKLVKSLDDIVDELKNVDKALDKTDTDSLEDSLKDLNNLVESGTLNFEDYSKVLEQYTDIALKAGQASPIGQEAIQNAANLKQEYQSVETAVDALAQKGSNLNAALQLGETVVAGYQAFIGIQALVGDENEELIEVLTKLQAVQSVAQGLQTVRNALDKESLILIKGKQIAERLFGSITKKNLVTQVATTTATKAQATATTGAAAAQTALNVAMNANPIFLIITAIVALVSALVIFIATSNDAADAQDAYRDSLDDATEAMDRQNRTLERNTAFKEQEIKSTNKVIDAEIKYLQSIKNRTKEQEKLLNSKLLERQANEIAAFDNAIESSEGRIKNFSQVFGRSLKFVEKSFAALREEDAIASIDYEGAQNQINLLKFSVSSLNEEFAKNDPEGYVKQVENFEGILKEVTDEFSSFRTVFSGEEDETEFLNETIDALNEFGNVVSDTAAERIKYNQAVKDKSVFQSLKALEAATQRQKEQEEAAERAARRRREREAELARERERLLQLQLNYERQAEDIRNSLIEDSYEREFQTLQTKLQRDLDAIEGNSEEANALRLALQDQYFAAEKALNDRREKERLDDERALQERIQELKFNYLLTENQKLLAEYRTQYQQEQELLTQALEQELITRELYDQLTVEQEKEYQAQIKALRDQAKKEEEEADKQKLERAIAITSEVVDRTAGFFDSLINLNNIVTETQLNNAEGNEKKQEEIRKRSFERNKKLQIVSAGIQGVQGVINALTAVSTIPEPFGSIAKGVQAAIVAATTAANISKISSTKYNGGSPSPTVSSGSASIGSAGASQVAGRDLSDIRTDLTDDNTSAEQNPLQVFVLESDITGTQATVNETAEKTTF